MSSKTSRSKTKSKPLDKNLYNRVKRETIKKFDVYPSAYANGYLVKRYKELGGKFSSRSSKKKSNLKRWYDERWVDISRPMRSKKGSKKTRSIGYESCGRKTSRSGKYPVCRPYVRISSKTPMTVKQMSKSSRNSAIRRKRLNPQQRIKF